MNLLHRFLIVLIIALSFPLYAYTQFVEAPKREYRTAWLTTIKGLDWPKDIHKGDYSSQRNHLCAILDSLQAININTVLLQTRIRGDVIYPSSIEPFAPVFSGKHGIAPDYDPLAFAIEECHKRSMQLHAWIVTIPLGDAAYVKGHGKHSLPARKPKQCTKFKGAWYMEPSHPATSEHLSTLVEEIITQYDVDGIHFDYIRYPEGNRTYPDGTKYNRTRKWGESHEDWRRDNITTVMSNLYSKIKSIKPWLCVSAATLGKYDDTSRYSSYGWNAYHTVCQEAQKWLRIGIVDVLFPMLYYTDNHFFPFVADWSEQSHGRHIVAGIGTYQLHKDEKDWELEEIIRQLHFVRAMSLGGAAQFRSSFVTENTKGIYDFLRYFYPFPALIPAMSWLSDTPPVSPQNLVVVKERYKTSLTWESNYDMLYNIYSSITFPVDINNPANLRKTYSRDNSYTEWTPSEMHPQHYAITAIDRYGNESEPLQWEDKTTRKISPYITVRK